jgi:hypothetical protein
VRASSTDAVLSAEPSASSATVAMRRGARGRKQAG